MSDTACWCQIPRVGVRYRVLVSDTACWCQIPRIGVRYRALVSDTACWCQIPRVGVRYRTDGGLFNLRKLKAKTIAKVDTVRDLLFADDSALCAGSQSGMQHTDHSQACSTQITVRHAAHRSQSGMQHTDHSQACSTQKTVRHAAHR